MGYDIILDEVIPHRLVIDSATKLSRQQILNEIKYIIEHPKETYLDTTYETMPTEVKLISLEFN